jgi:hypothetical protein
VIHGTYSILCEGTQVIIMLELGSRLLVLECLMSMETKNYGIRVMSKKKLMTTQFWNVKDHFFWKCQLEVMRNKGWRYLRITLGRRTL